MVVGGKDGYVGRDGRPPRARRAASARSGPPGEASSGAPTVKSHTVYKTFEIPERRAFVRITEDVQAAVDEAGIAEGMALVRRCTSPRASG